MHVVKPAMTGDNHESIFTVGLAMLAGAALGAAAVEGLHAQAKPPGTAQVLGHVNSRR